jgi:4-carboxymuconolactone decarboxylase
MTDTPPQNPFAQWMTQMQDMAKTMNPALEHFTPQGFEKLWPTMPKEAMEATMGKTFNPQGLDSKTRLLLTLAGLTAQGAVAEPQVRLTVRHAKEAGATEQEIAETIGMMGLFAGLPAMQKAMGLASEVLKEDSGE